MAIDIVFGRRLLYVGKNGRTVGDRPGAAPGPEFVAERVHVAVGPDARVTEQVPGAAHRIASLEDCVTLAGTFALQVARGTDTGQSRPDDDDIEILRTQRSPSSALSSSGSSAASNADNGSRTIAQSACAVRLARHALSTAVAGYF